MKQGIPKSVRDALTAQVPADEHPSADLLNGYAEHRLTGSENERVMTHLAACAECRDIVFLAGAAVEEPALAAVAAAAPQPMRRRRLWKWLVPVAAVAGMVSGIVVYREHAALTTSSARIEIAGNKTASSETSVTQSAPATNAPSPESFVVKSAPLSKRSPQQPQTVHKDLTRQQTAMLAKSPASSPIPVPALPVAPVPSSAQPPPAETAAPVSTGLASPQAAGAPSQTVKVTSAAPLIQADSGQATGGLVNTPLKQSLKSSLAGVSKTAAAAPKMRASNPSAAGPTGHPAQWRITTSGYLERSQAASGWTRLLGDQPVSFRAVAVIGDNVWAGGSNGELFHSSDSGEHWNKANLGEDGQMERGAIISIRFDSASQGSVTSDSGVTWSTTDGGQTWRRR